MVYALEVQLVDGRLNCGWILAIVTGVFVVLLSPCWCWDSSSLSFLPNPVPFDINKSLALTL
jgi:hypothetical protein